MNPVFIQRLDQIGGGSRASLTGTLSAIRELRPGWRASLVTASRGPVSDTVEKLGGVVLESSLPRFRKPLSRLFFGPACAMLAGKLKTFRPTHIISNEWVTAPHARRVAARLGVPALSWVRDFAAVDRGKKYELHLMDGLICVCDDLRDQLVGAGYDPAKVHAVYNPVKAPGKADAPPPVIPDSHAGIDHWLLYVAKLSPRKNQIAAVEVLRELRRTTGASWGLALAGDADAAYAERLDAHIRDTAMESSVLRLGHCPDPGPWFRHADATVLTSGREGLARVLIESLLCGTPGFSFPIEGIRDVFGAETGRFVPEDDAPASLAACIAAAFRDRDGLEGDVSRLRHFLAERHSREAHVDTIGALLDGVSRR